MDRGWKTSEAFDRKSLDYFKQNVGGNRDLKDILFEGSEENEVRVMENWRKVGSCNIVAENFTELSYGCAFVFQNN